MTQLSYDDILNYHDKILSTSGGRQGVLDQGLIESALARPFSGTSTGEEFYPTLFQKVAAMAQSFCLNHGFNDGNKRTGLVAGMLLLFRNGYYIPTPNEDEATDFVLSIVDEDRIKRLNIAQIAKWFEEHAKRIEEGYTEDYLRHIRLRYTGQELK